jgi:phage shock protein C
VPDRPVPEGKNTMGTLSDLFRRNGLTRPADGRILGGVCAGLGRRLGLAPWRARLVFVLVLLVIPGSQLLVYPVLWILMPRDLPGQPAVPPAGSRPERPTP